MTKEERESEDKRETDAAYEIFLGAIGTPREHLARVYHQCVVAKVKARNEGQR